MVSSEAAVGPDERSADQSPCVFLGAGASACAGYRTFLSFPHMFFSSPRRASALHAPDNEYALLEGVREQLRRTKRRETLDNYLWVLDMYYTWTCTALSRADLRDRFPNEGSFWPRAVDLRDTVHRLRRSITRLSIEHYASRPKAENPEAWGKRLIDFYSYLGRLPGGVSIFTTNYDLLPEYLCSSQAPFREWREQAGLEKTSAIQFENGIEDFEQCGLPHRLSECTGGGGGPRWEDTTYSEAKTQGQEEGLVQVHRLHGCVAWYYDAVPEDAPVRFVLPTDLQQFCDEAPDFDKRLCVMYPGREEKVGRAPHGPGFVRLYEASRKSGGVLFVGFAFEDDDVIRAVFSSLVSVENRRLSVVDPRLTALDVVNKVEAVRTRSSLPLWVPSEHDVRLYQTDFPPHDTEDLARAVSMSP